MCLSVQLCVSQPEAPSRTKTEDETRGTHTHTHTHTQTILDIETQKHHTHTHRIVNIANMLVQTNTQKHTLTEYTHRLTHTYFLSYRGNLNSKQTHTLTHTHTERVHTDCPHPT